MILINGPSRCQNRRPGAGCRDAGIRSGRPLAWRGDLRSPLRGTWAGRKGAWALQAGACGTVASAWWSRASWSVTMRPRRRSQPFPGPQGVPAANSRWEGSLTQEEPSKCLGTGTYGVHGSIYGPDYELRPRDFRHLGGSARSTAQLWPAVLFGEQGMTLFTRLPPLNVYRRSSSCKDF